MLPKNKAVREEDFALVCCQDLLGPTACLMFVEVSEDPTYLTLFGHHERAGVLLTGQSNDFVLE